MLTNQQELLFHEIVHLREPLVGLFFHFGTEQGGAVKKVTCFWEWMRRKIFDNMQVVHIWCICCILNIIRFTVKSISSLLHVTSTSAVNEAKMKRTKIFRFEVWDESVWQHLIGDKSIRQAEKNPSGNIWQIHVASWKVWRRRIGGGKFCHKIATLSCLLSRADPGLSETFGLHR